MFVVRSILLAVAVQSTFAAGRHGVFHPDVQKAQCIPDTNDAKNWPVKAIYLHGYFDADQSNSDFIDLERTNRQAFAKVARAGHYRIAVIVSDTIVTKPFTIDGPTTDVVWRNYRSWDDGSSLATVKDAARAACGSAAIIDQPALIGFSAGGYSARSIGCYSDNPVDESVSKVLVNGAPEKIKQNCDKPFMRYRDAHELNEEYLLDELKYLNEPSVTKPPPSEPIETVY